MAYPEQPAGYVTDLAEVIDADTERELELRIQALQNDTTAEIAVVTIPSLEGEDISMLGTEIGQKRAVGTAEVDNGILVLLAVQERQWRVDVGYGLE